MEPGTPPMIPLSYELLVAELATLVSHRVSRRVIRRLQAMKDCTLSGEDSELKSIWDEICVQVQGQHSVYWETYRETLYVCTDVEVGKLTSFELAAVWLETPQGWDWSVEDEECRDPNPVNAEEVVAYIVERVVLSAASDWTNARIRLRQERSYLD